MDTFKLAEDSTGSWNDPAPPYGPGYAKLFSTIQDISHLLRFDCSQEQETDKPRPQFHHRRIKAGEVIYRLGQPFKSLYVVRLGFLKTVLRDSEGYERVLSFPTKGNLMGFEGICRDRYGTEAIALTNGELVIIPFKQLMAAEYFNRELEQMIYMAISREFAEEHTRICLSGPLKSEARVARFLEEFAEHNAALGYSSQEMSLPMTRRDMGCYLGLTLETVSRSLSALAAEGIISVHGKNIQIRKPELLHLFQSFTALPRKDALTGSFPLVHSMSNKPKSALRPRP